MRSKDLAVSPPNFQCAEIQIEGTAPYVQHKFSEKARTAMREKQEKGSQAKKNVKREPKDFKAMYEGAQYHLEDASYGIPAPAFRNAMISACRLVDQKMTIAKMAIFIEADGFDKDGTPLVRFTRGQPEYLESYVRLASGVVDLCARPKWNPGWRAVVRVRFDADRFSASDVLNLLARAGQQVGVGEGRPDSKESCGMGWGLFRPLSEMEVKS
jgi:hypothetical protein